MRYFPAQYGRFPHAGCCDTSAARKETAVLDALPRAGGQRQAIPDSGAALAGAAPQPPDAAQVAAAIGRYRACQALREFRARLYGCLTARADALFELCDAILCADHAVTSLVQLSLVPEFRRGHGALYDALAAGQIDEEAFAQLLADTLPQLIDDDHARTWIAGHDQIDYGLLDQALAGLPEGEAAAVREACARWRRLRFAVDATPYPRPDAECSPGRGHVHHDACRCDSTRKTIPGWEYQFTAALGHLRTAWAALVDVERTTPATRTRQTARQVKNLLRRLEAAGHDRGGAPLVIFDAGYSAAALTAALAGHHVHLLIRLASGSVFYAGPVTWPGKNGRPGKHGTRVACRKADDPDQSNPEPDESLTLPATPLYGTVRVDAWHQVHPSSTATAATSPAGTATCPSCPAPCCASPSGTCPAAANRTRPCGYGMPGPPRSRSTSYGAPAWPASTKNTPSNSPRAPSA